MARRLFETTADNDPNTANRIAFGRPGFASLYMTLANFLTWLGTNLTFIHGAWQTPSYVQGHSDYTTGDFSGLRYRKLANGMLQLAGSFQRSIVAAGIVFTLDAGFRPAQILPIYGRREDNTLVGGSINPAGTVTIFLDSSLAGNHMDLNVIMPLDLTV